MGEIGSPAHKGGIYDVGAVPHMYYARLWNLQYPKTTGYSILKFGFGYQTMNDLYP
jgi:hypothetical protein